MLSLKENISLHVTEKMTESRQLKLISSACGFSSSAGICGLSEYEFSPWLRAAALAIGTTESPRQGCKASEENHTLEPDQSPQSTVQEKNEFKKCLRPQNATVCPSFTELFVYFMGKLNGFSVKGKKTS